MGQPVDRRADLFSLGVVLWEVLAQRRLFRKESDQETAAAVVEGPIPPLSSLRSDISPALEAAVQRALERDPQRRFQTAEEMAAELARCTPGREAMTRNLSVLVEATMDLARSGFSALPARPAESSQPSIRTAPAPPAPPPSHRSGAMPPIPAAEKTAMVGLRRWGVLDRLTVNRSRMRLVQAGVLALLGFAAGALWQRTRAPRAPIPTTARAVITRPPLPPLGTTIEPLTRPPGPFEKATPPVRRRSTHGRAR